MFCGKTFTGKTVLSKVIMTNKFTKEEKAILTKLMRWCSLSEKCTADIRRWLLQKQLPLDNLEKITGYLIAHNYINETRYAAAFVHDKFLFNQWGRLKIVTELSKKNIPQPIIDKTIMNGIDEKEYVNMLKNLLKKKKKSLEGKEISIIKQKILNFALSKGFESELVYNEIEKLINN